MLEGLNFRLDVRFYRTARGLEPARDWLMHLPLTDRKAIGDDIRMVQLKWPIGMPLVRKMDAGLWEVRSDLDQRIARILFTVVDREMIVLHGFIKKSRIASTTDLDTARRRLRAVQHEASRR